MPKRQHDRLWWSALAVEAAVAWGAWLVLQNTTMLVVAVAVQLLAAAIIYFTASSRRRGLGTVLAVSVPVLGPFAAAWIETTRGRDRADLLVEFKPPVRRRDGREIARRLVASMPPCAAIASGNVEARRATFSRLVQRGGAEEIAIIRWAHRQAHPDISVEAALALEELGQRFEDRLRAARAVVKNTPTPTTHAEIVRAICDGVRAGIVDDALMRSLVAEARRHHLAAVAENPDLAENLALAIARIELAARQPSRALGVLRSVSTSSKELIELRREAAYAARRFDDVPALRPSEVAVGGR